MYIQPFSMQVNWSEIWCLMKVSTLFYICRYWIFTLWVRSTPGYNKLKPNLALPWKYKIKITMMIMITIITMIILLCLTDMQTSKSSICTYHCLGEVAFLKIWNKYWLLSYKCITVFGSSPWPIFKLSLQVPWIDSNNKVTHHNTSNHNIMCLFNRTQDRGEVVERHCTSCHKGITVS